MKIQHTSRGAMRHWVIGCGIVVVLLAAAIGGLGYFGWTKLKEKMDFGFIDTAKMVDPPLDAAPEALFPEKAGTFSRIELTTVTTIAPPPGVNRTQTVVTETTSDSGSTSTVTEETGFSVDNNMETSGPIVHAQYADPQSNIVYAYAMNPGQTAEIEKQHPEMLRAGRGGNKTGFHMTMKAGENPFSMATWTKRNWTYYIQTTATEAMSFVSQFSPGAAAPQ